MLADFLYGALLGAIGCVPVLVWIYFEFGIPRDRKTKRQALKLASKLRKRIRKSDDDVWIANAHAAAVEMDLLAAKYWYISD